MGQNFISDDQNIYLPASFLGSNKWSSEQITDSLAIAAAYGPLTFFITMTCNTNWPEIQSILRPGQDFRHHSCFLSQTRLIGDNIEDHVSECRPPALFGT